LAAANKKIPALIRKSYAKESVPFNINIIIKETAPTEILNPAITITASGIFLFLLLKEK
jgi:hypothetical protein